VYIFPASSSSFQFSSLKAPVLNWGIHGASLGSMWGYLFYVFKCKLKDPKRTSGHLCLFWQLLTTAESHEKEVKIFWKYFGTAVLWNKTHPEYPVFKKIIMGRQKYLHSLIMDWLSGENIQTLEDYDCVWHCTERRVC